MEDWAAERRKVLKPYFTWDDQIRQANIIEGWEPDRSSEVIKAIAFLRNILGEGFPDFVLENEHHSSEFFFNKVPWAKEWFIWLADSLQELGEGQNFHIVLNHFKSAKEGEFKEAESLLYFGLKFKKTGYHVDFEQEILNRNLERKKPDLKLTHTQTGDVIYCEIARLIKGDLDLLFESIPEHLIRGGIIQSQHMIQYCGSLYERVSKSKFDVILDKIDSKIKLLDSSGEMQVLIIEGTIEIAIARYNDPILKSWAVNKGYTVNEWRIPLSDIFYRTGRKIFDKAKQLSPNHPNIIIIQQEDGLFRYASPETWLQNIEETTMKHEDIMAVIVTVLEFLGDTESEMKLFDSNYYIQRPERYALGSRSLVIFNKSYKRRVINEDLLVSLFKNFV